MQISLLVDLVNVTVRKIFGSPFFSQMEHEVSILMYSFLDDDSLWLAPWKLTRNIFLINRLDSHHLHSVSLACLFLIAGVQTDRKSVV